MLKKISYFIILVITLSVFSNLYADTISDELIVEGKALVEAAIKVAQENTSKYENQINENELKLKELDDVIREYLSKQEQVVTRISEEEEKIKKLKEKPLEIRYSVIRGDSLWKIAKRNEVYGDPYKWTKIYHYNKDQIKNPDLIYPGQIFRVPLAPIGEGDMPTKYEVVKGDSLWKIAGYEKIYGDPYKWPVIYKANKDQIKDPNIIYPYQILEIPRQLSMAN